LILLVTRSPGFITPTQLLVQAWHDARLPEETLRTYIGKVRTKLHSLGVDAEIINRPRHGYALVFKHRPEDQPPDSACGAPQTRLVQLVVRRDAQNAPR